jgi:hypothetical protein
MGLISTLQVEAVIHRAPLYPQGPQPVNNC